MQMLNLGLLQKIKVLLVQEESKKRSKIRKRARDFKLNFMSSWMKKRLKKPRKG
jgi:hypothetical protein